MGSRNWPGKLDLMNVILTGVAEELPGKGPGYELHRLLGTLFPSELTVRKMSYGRHDLQNCRGTWGFPYRTVAHRPTAR